ncbi:MAG: rRNA maturation RNase YbeY [Candidatus Margulisbacteria bacterium]|nr:rRNA maturation RNase YbeY [Candidatus Margulisiibacteriota bacterium]
MNSEYDSLMNEILKSEGVKGKINLVFVSDHEIRRLNGRFRGKNKATDVLSFPMGENGILGDIAISVDTAGRNAQRFGVQYKREVKRLVIHGVLHLLGYDHGRRMQSAEETYKKF